MGGRMTELAAAGGPWLVGLALAAGAVAAMAMASDKAAPSVFDVWDKVKAPPPPKLEAVKLAPKTTALLILDIEKLTTNMQRRPRAVASVPRIAALLAKARAAGMPVAYSLTSRGEPETILKEVTPRKGERGQVPRHQVGGDSEEEGREDRARRGHSRGGRGAAYGHRRRHQGLRRRRAR